MQGLVLQWGDEKFLVCLHSQWKDTRTYFMKTPPLLHIPFFEFCPTTPPPPQCHLQAPPQLFFLLPCFFSLMGDHTTFVAVFYLMDLPMSSLATP